MKYSIENVYLDNSDFHSNKFSLLKQKTLEVSMKTVTGVYQRISWRFLLKRNIGSYIVQFILPSLTLVFVSCISYWLHPIQNVTSRIILGIGCLILLVILQIFARLDCHATYTTIHDSWYLTCFIFIVFTLVELLLIHLITYYKFRSKTNTKEDGNTEMEIFEVKRTYFGGDCIVDKVCRILVPSVFLLFAIIFWSVKSSSSQITL